MQKKMLFFINPNAGHAEIRSHLMEVLQVFTAGGYSVTVHPTSGPRDLTQKIIADAGDYDLVVCTGGDGTLNEAVSGLMKLPREQRPPLGYIPGGTVNDMAANLGLSKDCVEAAKQIVRGTPFAIDVGSFCGQRWFAYVAAYGLFTDVPYETPQQDKRALGRLAYLLAGARTLTGVKTIPTRVTCGGQTVECDALDGLVCNTTSVGGFKTKGAMGSMDVSLSDGMTEIVVVHNIKTALDLGKAAGNLMRMELQNEYFFSAQSQQVRFEFPYPVAWTLDGEFGGEWQQVDICILRQEVEIIVPSDN